MAFQCVQCAGIVHPEDGEEAAGRTQEPVMTRCPCRGLVLVAWASVEGVVRTKAFGAHVPPEPSRRSRPAISAGDPDAPAPRTVSVASKVVEEIPNPEDGM